MPGAVLVIRTRICARVDPVLIEVLEEVDARKAPLINAVMRRYP
jgi:hypothetical protein